MRIEIRYVVLALILASVLYVHFRGRVRLPFFRRQLTDHSSFFAPYNVLAYLFSAVPIQPYLERKRFPQLDALREQWHSIRNEALRLFDEGYVKGVERGEDLGFSSFFKKGWKRFHLKWYGSPLPSARALCPNTVELLRRIPSVRAAMFALLPPGAELSPHRDPFAGSLRYHLGLVTPNSDECRIVVDGQPYSWRDGEDVVFDETYVHWAENRTNTTRIILFCDVDRPLRSPVLRVFNRLLGVTLGRATAARNLHTEPLGTINRLYFVAHHTGEASKWLKRTHKRIYLLLKLGINASVLYLLLR